MNIRKDTNDLLVSTIIPSYNKHHFLKDALLSVLSQSHQNQEVIIVNDYPTAQAKEELEELQAIDKRIILLHNDANIGIAASRNEAIGHCKGDMVAMLDHDDLWNDPDKLKKQLSVLVDDNNLAVVGTQYHDVDKDGNILRKKTLPLTDSSIRERINICMPSLQSSLVFRKETLDKIGGFDESVSMADDYEILFRALQVGTMQNLADFTTLYRLHENTSANHKNQSVMRSHSLKILFHHGKKYPHYMKAVLHRLLVVYPYGFIRPYLSDELVAYAKKIRDHLFGISNQ